MNDYACLLLGGSSCDMRYGQETRGAPVKSQVADSGPMILRCWSGLLKVELRYGTVGIDSSLSLLVSNMEPDPPSDS